MSFTVLGCELTCAYIAPYQRHANESGFCLKESKTEGVILIQAIPRCCFYIHAHSEADPGFQKRGVAN